MARVCIFDVNETLLDLRALDPHFERAFGSATTRRSWFMQMIQNALVATVTDTYTPFGTLGAAALEMTAAQRGIDLHPDDRTAILLGMRTLPAHSDVPEGLRLLRDAGVRLAALTNSTAEVARAQLDHAGLSGYFEQILSADTVKRLKPAPQPYHHAAERMAVPVDQIRLIAAHAWDIVGAMRAGCAAAFVARPGQVLDPTVEQPDITGSDLIIVGKAILNLERP